MCPHCKHDARFVSRRGKTFDSLLGGVRVKRCYYHCRDCREGYLPWDAQLGLGKSRQTPATREVCCIEGVRSSFAEASDRALYKLTGLRLSESTVQRVTESSGQQVAEHLHGLETFGEEKPWQWNLDASGKSCSYVSVDLTGIRQQGPGGSHAEGKMATVGMIYNPSSPAEEMARRPKREPHQVRYLAGFYDLDQLGLELRRQAAQVGWDEAEQQIALSDGGAGLEEFFRKNFPLAERILDFWHAKEHLRDLGQALFGESSDEGRRWLDDQCHRLKHEGGAAMLAVLEGLEVSLRSAAVQEVHRSVTGYFRNHQQRMDYPRYVAAGWAIGSGPVESSCGTVVGNRLKGGGMRWGPVGSDSVCHLRALFLSEPTQWDDFWHPLPA